MEEKKITKISLKTFFLILAIIVIIVMGVFIYKLSHEKTVETGKVAKLNNEISNLQGTVNQLNGNLDNISNTTNSNTSNMNESSDLSNTSSTENIATSTESSKTSTKEIYKRVKTKDIDKSDLKYYNERYLVLEGNSIYFSDDLSDKILEGTYTVDSKNNIEYNFPYGGQDYAFYVASNFRFETINGKKNIVIANDNEMMYFEKVN